MAKGFDRLKEEHAVAVERDLFTHAYWVKDLFAGFHFADRKEGWKEDPTTWLQKHSGSRIVFSNPYRDRAIENLYQMCRITGHAMLVVERGPLPGTLFMDCTGFLADSQAYDRSFFPGDLHSATYASAQRLRHAYFHSKDALEPQRAKRAREKTYQHPVPKQYQKHPVVLFILQMPSDTVTRHFTLDNHNYDDFLDWCGQCVARLSDIATFQFRPHPRAQEVRFVDADNGAMNVAHLHIDDALARSDLVVTFNSGTGILAMMHDKPVAVYGDAFYKDADGVRTVQSVEEMEMLIQQLGTPEARPRYDPFLEHLGGHVLSEVTYLPETPSWKRRKIAITPHVIRLFDGEVFYEKHYSGGNSVSARFQAYAAAAVRILLNRFQRTVA